MTNINFVKLLGIQNPKKCANCNREMKEIKQLKKAFCSFECLVRYNEKRSL